MYKATRDSWSFDSAPGTSSYAESQGVTGALDELHITVIDEDGQWTGTAGTVLETFAFVSQAVDAKLDNGESNFYKDVVNARSKYVWWMDHDSALTDAGTNLSTAANSFDIIAVTHGMCVFLFC